jgi:hypothetical protein
MEAIGQHVALVVLWKGTTIAVAIGIVRSVRELSENDGLLLGKTIFLMCHIIM